VDYITERRRFDEQDTHDARLEDRERVARRIFGSRTQCVG
jgi:hypothetical protein